MYTMKCDGEDFYSPFAASEGYGVISPKINYELNKAGSLEFTLPPDNVMYDFMKKLKSIITVYKDGEEIFRGRVLHDDKDFYRRKHVYCEGELSLLNDSVIRPYTFSGSVADLFRKYIEEHNNQVEVEKQFTVGIVDFVDTDVEEQYETYVFVALSAKPSDWDTNYGSYFLKEDNAYYEIVANSAPEFEAGVYYRKDTETQTRLTTTEKENTEFSKTLDEIMTQLVAEFGGYLRIRHEDGTRYIDYVSDYGKNSGQIISCGVNMLDLSEYITAENLVTCLIPLGSSSDGERVTIASVNNGVDYICNETAIRLFGKIWAVQEWDDISNPEKLKIKAEEYLQNNISMNVSITVTAVDLNLVDVDVERLKLGDSVRVVSEPHELDSYFVCSKVTLDLLEADKSSYTLGYSFSALTDQQVSERIALARKFAIYKNFVDSVKTTADKALSTANSARSYASGSASALKKNIATLIASDEKLQAGISAKVSQEDLKNALANYALASSLADYLTVTAAAELYATDADVMAVIGSYIVTDANGNKKSLAAILADQIKLQGRVDVTGSIYVESGRIRTSGSIKAGGGVSCSDLDVSSNYVNLGSNTLTLQGDVTMSADGINLAGNIYSPQEITSTSGAVLALGTE